MTDDIPVTTVFFCPGCASLKRYMNGELCPDCGGKIRRVTVIRKCRGQDFYDDVLKNLMERRDQQ